ncbi:LamG-like jellyroll fold domain-containing protein [Candidatus Eisenbacteria bacterium]|uniref:LamG-like jellyroll fold domain-containing protein n=1 Tax=Eiseniibacteriota bacterium TaxID=2212470 RepID=A0ABV6YLH2_UNCEI
MKPKRMFSVLCCTITLLSLTSIAFAQDDYALLFDQSDGYDIALADKWIPGVHDEWTMEAWFYAQTHAQDNHAVIVQHRADWHDKVIRQMSDGRITFREYYGGSSLIYSMPAPTLLSEWHHVAMVSTADRLSFFFDGDSLGSLDKIHGSSDWDTGFFEADIGGTTVDHSGDGFSGAIDEVRIWNVSRSGDEIRAAMNEHLTGSEPGLVAYYDCDDGEGQVLTDHSTSGNHGQLGTSPTEDEHDPTWIDSNDWPYIGACCFADGSCMLTTEVGCSGLWLGEGTVCDPNACLQPMGACCYPDDTCLETLEVDCPTGDWRMFEVCDPNPCFQLEGNACCVDDGLCLVLPEDVCTEAGGEPQVEETCIPGLCPLGSGGPNAGGTLIVHSTPQTDFTYDFPSYCGQSGLTGCESANTNLPGWDSGPYVWWATAAFRYGSSPRLAGVTFGIDYDAYSVFLLDWGECGDFSLSTGGWPAPNEGTAISWSSAQTNQLTEVYWFAGYEYYGQDFDFCLTPHPTQGACFADDDIPANVDDVAGLGCLGFNDNPGYLPCPDPLLGACCRAGQCYITTDEVCMTLGGVWFPETNSCYPNPCIQSVGGSTPLRRAVLLTALPSPFTQSTLVRFRLSSPALIRLSVHDAAGRLIRTLASGHAEAGLGSVKWDGSNDYGVRVGPGVYFFRLNVHDKVLSERVILVE